MQKMLMDTDILSRFLRGDARVGARVREYLAAHGTLHVSVITRYEILSGLYHRDARRQLERFHDFLAILTPISLSDDAVEHAARCYAATREAGTPVDDMDLLIAGIALANGMGVATHNLAHFSKIPGLALEDWAL